MNSKLHEGRGHFCFVQHCTPNAYHSAWHIVDSNQYLLSDVLLSSPFLGVGRSML